MRCSKAQKLISASLDGELDEARELAAKLHLVKCHSCQSFAADLLRCAAALDRLTVPNARTDFTARLMARIPESKSVRTWWKGGLDALQPVPAGLGTLALSCGVVMAVLMNGETVPTDSERAKPGPSLYAGCFDPLPEGSVAERYVALVREGGE